MLLSAHGAGDDATYLHTPNPNKANFPIVIEGMRWEALLDPELASLFPPALSLRVGRPSSGGDGHGSWFVYASDVGVPLEGEARSDAPATSCSARERSG